MNDDLYILHAMGIGTHLAVVVVLLNCVLFSPQNSYLHLHCPPKIVGPTTGASKYNCDDLNKEQFATFVTIITNCDYDGIGDFHPHNMVLFIQIILHILYQ